MIDEGQRKLGLTEEANRDKRQVTGSDPLKWNRQPDGGDAAVDPH